MPESMIIWLGRRIKELEPQIEPYNEWAYNTRDRGELMLVMYQLLIKDDEDGAKRRFKMKFSDRGYIPRWMMENPPPNAWL